MSETSPRPTAEAALVALATHVMPVWIRHLATSRTHAEEAVASMLSAFAEISPLIESNSTNTADTANSTDAASKTSELIERMYVGFQHEDRINQMLSLLLGDMQRMLALISDPHQQTDEAFSYASWLGRLESQYAMAEQRHGQSDLSATQQSGNTDFF